VLGQALLIPQLIFASAPYLGICLLFLAIMFIDWVMQKTNFLQSTNFRRIVTGTLGGYGLLGVYYYLFVGIIHLFT